MHPFWSQIYDQGKDRRYGALFFSTLVMLFGSLGVIALLSTMTNSAGLVPALILFAVPFSVVLVCMVSNCVRGLKRRDETGNCSTLSRDELAKARSKLKKETKAAAFRTGRKPAQLVMNRVPDTYLKY
jgi:choline-glycine betaine transporter